MKPRFILRAHAMVWEERTESFRSLQRLGVWTDVDRAIASQADQIHTGMNYTAILGKEIMDDRYEPVATIKNGDVIEYEAIRKYRLES